MKDTLYIDGKRQPVASLKAAHAAIKAGKVVVVVDSANVAAEVTPKKLLTLKRQRRAVK